MQYSDYLWIDDLCIDQTNISERSHQVSIMGSIYTQAAKTIVWLGAATEETAKDMQDITKMFGEKDYTARERYVGLYDELFSRPYWRRMWIQQEYLLSSNISIWCGEGALEPAVLYGLYKLLNGSGIGTNGGWRSIQFVQLHNLRYSVGINHRGSSLAAKLGITVILQCADPRDRVYALISVLSTQEREAWGIEPDYAKSAQDLCDEMHRKFEDHSFPICRYAMGDNVNENFLKVLRDILWLDKPSGSAFDAPKPSSRR